MPGNPPTSPRFNAPRYSESDDVVFSAQVNSVTDTFDVKVASYEAGHAPGDLVVSAAASRNGCLLCDGSQQSRSTYSALFAAIGTAYGTGNGSTTFNLPDFRGRTIVGAGAGPGLTARSPGAVTSSVTWGEEGHTLNTGEMPSHDHGGGTGNDVPDHSHTPANAASAFATNLGNNFLGSGSGWGFQATTSGASTRHGHSISAQGGSQPHNNMPPFGVANVFIFTGTDIALPL